MLTPRRSIIECIDLVDTKSDPGDNGSPVLINFTTIQFSLGTTQPHQSTTDITLV